MRLDDVLKALRSVGPEPLAEPWDKVGLQLGELGQEVASALLCIDLTEAVLDEAIKTGVGLIVAYHPPIFKPLDALTEADPKQRIVLRAAREGLAIYSPHTTLDAAAGGTNDFLADGLGEGTRRPITPAAPPASGALVKLVVYVPSDDAEAMRKALSKAGAGEIGPYRGCSFAVVGEGTFRGSAASNPAVGQPQRLERVEEVRLEMLCPRGGLKKALAALWKAHPYEEPAYDIFAMEPEPRLGAGVVPESSGHRSPQEGAGRVIELDQAIALDELAQRVKRRLKTQHVEVGKPRGAGKMRRIGLCVGAGGALREAAGPLDAFITGEMRHHDQLAALAAGTAVVLAGHTQTERPYLPEYRRRLIAAGTGEVDWHLSRADRAPMAMG